MKKYCIFLLTIVGFFIVKPVNATHVMGGAITWEAISKDTFKVLLTYYRDCNGINQDSATIDVSSNCLAKQLKATLVSKEDISPFCTSVCSRCTDRSCSVNYGIEKIELSALLVTTDFIKRGCCNLTLSWSTCCRSIPLLSTNQNFYLESKMNACLSNGNNSPSFIVPPVSLLCLGQEQVISCAAFDYENDSLRYTLTPALKDSATSITYQTPYTYTKPIYYQGFPKTGLNFPDGFHFNKKDGLLKFKPTKIEQGVFAYKVFEYRNGKIISEVTHDMLLVIIKCPNNVPPVLSGINCKKPKAQNFEIEVCPGEKVEFKICASDNDKADTVRLGWNEEIPEATFTITNRGSKREEGLFSWTPTLTDSREEPYTFAVEAYDNACPLIGKTTRTYSIKVKELGPSVSIDSFIGSCGNIFAVAKTKGNAFSKSFIWQIGDQKIVHNGGTSDTLIFKTKESGKVPFRIQTIGYNSCSNYYNDTFQVQEHLSIKTIEDTMVCAGSILNITSTSSGNSTCCKQKITWSTGDTANGISSSINFNVGSVDTSVWVSTSNGTCNDSDFVNIYIRKLPNVSLPDSQFFCLGSSSIIYPTVNIDTNLANYSLAFEWRKSGMSAIISIDTFLAIDSVGIYHLTAVDDLGCKIADSINLTENKSWTPKDTFVCGNNPILIKLPINSTIKYKWRDNRNDTTISFIGSKRTLSITNPRFFRILSVENTGRAQCQILDSFWVGVEKKPTIITSPSIGHACPNTEFTFLANTPGGKWTGLGIASNAQQLNILADSALLGQSAYVYTYTNTKSCRNSDTSILYTWPKPIAVIQKRDSLINLNDKILLKSISKNAGNAIATWVLKNPDTLIINQDSISITFNTIGPSSATLILIDSLTKCSDSTFVQYWVQKQVSLPFTGISSIQMFPNPTSGLVHISGLESNGQLNVFNNEGQLLISKHLSKSQNILDLSNLANGFYFYQIISPKGSTYGKFILNK